ncbi:DUF1376 domain-containing protein [Psychrobacter sp. Arc29]|uniref:YdaU family protein n=1 Tax=Psychrobacter sp. Arc29 TaxID=3046690 RepID=UPI00352C55B0
MMHYYSFNIADYKKDTAHLKPMEHYIYRSLIDLYYLNETPIPLKTHSVMRWLSLETHDHEKMLLDVLNDFFEEREDGFYHRRIDDEIGKYHANAEKNRENGKKGGRPPKNKPKKTQSVSTGNQLESKLNPNQEPITNNQEPLTNKTERELLVESLFDVWLEASGQKIKPLEKRMSHINARLDDGFTAEQIADVMTFVATDKWHIDEGHNTIEIAIRSTEQFEKKLIKATAVKNQSANQGNTDAHSQPANSQHQQFDTSTTSGYAAQLDADADAYYAEQAAIAEQTAYGSPESAF